MSVYKRPGSAVYSYDFSVRGRRFSGSTGCTTKREAERVEEIRRQEARAGFIDTSKPLTMAEACSLHWIEIGQHHADTKATIRIFGWLQDHVGPKTLISDIDDAMVARLIAKKRTETRPRRIPGKKKPVCVRISNATVNRSMIEPLRALLARAGDVWGGKVQRIEWKRHKLKEAQERVREASAEEEGTALGAMREDYRPPLEFALLTGCRRAEIVSLKWQDVDFFNREFRVKGKGDRSRTIPMDQAVFDLLWSLKDDHPEAVFTYIAQRPAKGRIRGGRYPITVNGFQTMWTRHVRGKLTDFRFHDTRHTAATRLVRATGNIKLAKELLGHASMATTSRYAHVTKEDLRKGLEAASRARTSTQNTTKEGVAAGKPLKARGNSEGE